MQQERVLTGIRSNGEPHIGNYLGAMLPMIEIQKRHEQSKEMFFFVPDLHSFTTPVDHTTLYQHTVRNLKYYVAAGMDFWAEGTFLYRQSYISAHSELTWILNCFAYFGELGRMTQFKDKSANEERNVSVGLFDYPVLMAADILLYNARYIPVGEDQRQHLEITRDLGIRINNKFEDVFSDGVFKVIPENWDKQLEFSQRDRGVRIRSLRNPEKKMSKSVSDPAGTIGLLDDPKDAAKKIMSATTDSVGSINYDWQAQPGISNLIQILALLTGKPVHEIAAKWQGNQRYGDLKQATAQEVERLLTDFQSKTNSINETKLIAKLEEDEAKVNQIAKATLLRVQQAVGLRPR
ncbi:MAG: tryptophan--tRNA ligase [Candidatus Woesebacteria bacterium]|jgi:tryptophanyl-tRNA synthetase